MRTIAGLLAVMVLVAAPPSAARAGDAETIEAINQAAAKLDRAFEQQDAATIKQLMTPDHVAVTPYYDGPQLIDDQIASLPDLKYEQTNLGEVAVALLGPDLAQRSFSAALDGTFKGKPIPRQVFVSELWVKGEGGWQEKFYQVTAMRHAGKHGACRGVAGTYLTKNVMKDGSADGFTSRSLITLGRSGLALFTDSGEGGEAGFAPFTDGRGTWRCLPNGEIGATTLDFTVPTAGKPDAEIGRLDFKLVYDPASKTLTGTATLYLVPLGQDPMVKANLKDGREFEITGQRVEAP
jgi:ketosteroid isomerase-like protein